MADYLSPSASNYADLSAKVRKTLPPEDQIHLHYAAMRKYDGVSGCVDLDAGTMTSRTGEDYSVSCAHIIEQCRWAFGTGGKIYGEVWHPTDPQSKISGDFRRQSSGTAEHLVFVVFDCHFPWADDPGQAGRYNHIVEAVAFGPEDTPALQVAAYYNPGTYGTGKQLMETYMPGGGYDGLVYYNPQAAFAVGKDKLGNIIKEKPSLDYDLEVLDTELGKGKYSKVVGALICRFKGGVFVRISGMTDKERLDWAVEPERIIGKIIKVEAMGLSSNGSLREPRYKGIRFDKIKADF